MKPKKIAEGTKLPVILTKRELKLIQNDIYYHPDFGLVGIQQGKDIKIMLKLADIEDVQGYVAAEANHTDNRKLQKELDRIFIKLQYFIDHYNEDED